MSQKAENIRLRERAKYCDTLQRRNNRLLEQIDELRKRNRSKQDTITNLQRRLDRAHDAHANALTRMRVLEERITKATENCICQ